MDSAAEQGRAPVGGRRFGQVGWALFDWAVSPFTTLVITFVFAAYFTQAVVGDPVEGQALWSLTSAITGVVFALTAPMLGAIADSGGGLKKWIAGFTLLGAAVCGGSSRTRPLSHWRCCWWWQARLAPNMRPCS
jgi:UMF1 family MFS transporter